MWESRMEVEVCLTTSSEAKLKGNHFTVRVHHWLIKLLTSAMRILLHSFVTTLSIKFVVAITRHSPPPPCCTGIFSRGNHHASHWHRGLQQAVYHSLTQHSAFDGSLDDRAERDRRLWKRISAAEFSRELSELDDIQTGVLINVDHILEFHPSNYNCPDRECRKTVMALWEIHKTDYSKGYHIVVKLPVSHSYIEDSYEYTTYEGLKHLGVENKHKEYTYRYTIGSDGRPSLKTDHRRVYKPIKFPVWNKNKNIYDLKKKEFHSIDGKNHDISEEDERDDKVIRIEPRRRFHNRDSLKPKKQGLVLAYVPGNSHREFQLPDQKYDGFIPIQHDSLKQVYNRDSYRHDAYEKEYDSRYLKGYEDAIRKYIIEQRNKPKISPDFHPSKPYIQYSEPDPLYIHPSYIPQSEEKINHDQSRILVIQKYPESQVSVKNLAGITPTVPYISLTVSNKIPVQNINQFELSTTATTKTVTIPSTTSSSNQTVNITNNDVELITTLNNSPLPLSSTITTVPTETTQQPQKIPATNAATDTSREELTTTTLQPTTLASINNLDVSSEDSKLIFIKTSPNRNIIKKDTTSRISTINGNILSEPSTQINRTEAIINITTEIQPGSATDSTKISNDTEKKSPNQSSLEETDKITTEDPKQIMSTQNLEFLMSTTIKTTLATQLENEYTVISTTGVNNKADTLNTIPTATTIATIPSTTTTATETTTNYLEEARNQLADLFASLTFDLFDEQPPFTSNSQNQQPINNTSIQQNFSDILDNTNYDDFLNEEITESYKDVQRYVNHALIPINKQSGRNLTQLFSSRRHSNSH